MKLKEIREAKKKTQAEIASRMNVSQQAKEKAELLKELIEEIKQA